jgi:ribonuclease HII
MKVSALRRLGIKYLIGVDEVGRGPLAGPVTVCAFLLPCKNEVEFPGVKESKQLTHEERVAWLQKINIEKGKKTLTYAVSHVSALVIDTIGLTQAINRALKNSLRRLGKAPHECMILLDGGLRAPVEYIYQKTIIKGDEKETVIALASVVAKVSRDRVLVRMSKKYPKYDFHVHKGYGTKIHFERLSLYGPCKIHRRLFLRKFKAETKNSFRRTSTDYR